MVKPLISICLSTRNRASFLEECLSSITSQISKDNKKYFEIIVEDGASTDRTNDLIRKYVKKFGVRYYRDKVNYGLAKSYAKVHKRAKGKYVWYFSDDDLMNKGALDIVIDKLQKFDPDVALVNIAFFRNSDKKVLDKNLLGVKKDYFFKDKKDFFRFLTRKFFYKVDWYNTYISNLILKKEIAKKSSEMPVKFPFEWALFPHLGPIYYYPEEYSFLIISKTLVKYRFGNTSWGPKDKISFLKFWDNTLGMHYQTLVNANRQHLGPVFILNTKLKRLIRKARIWYLEVLNFPNVLNEIYKK